MLSEPELNSIRLALERPSPPDYFGSIRSPVVLLVDNGSVRAGAHVQLRALARRLELALGGCASVKACSARHSDKVPARAMPDGKAPDMFAKTLYGALRAQSMLDKEDGGVQRAKRRAAGVPAIVVLPLFFGPSRTIKEFLPGQVEEVCKALGSSGWGVLASELQSDVTIARPLVDLAVLEPSTTDAEVVETAVEAGAAAGAAARMGASTPAIEVPSGAAHLAHILRDNVGAAVLAASTKHSKAVRSSIAGTNSPLDDVKARHAASASSVLLVEHGSPSKEVNQVRRALSVALQNYIAAATPAGSAPPSVTGCAMERREGKRFDFCDPMLENAVQDAVQSSIDPAGAADEDKPVVLAMQFALPGKHAGAGGDVAEIVEGALKGVSGGGRPASAGDGKMLAERVLTSPLVSEHPALLELLVSRFNEACSGIEAPPVRS